ncbi:MAG: two component transcriptional regulator [Caulobacteraceae bacterium]|nr:two component transcriptional regulator [Caulobacteraceae bacterium]
MDFARNGGVSALPKLLTIEDDAATAAEIAREMSGRGFEVDCVEDGEEGLRRAATNTYDAITLDRLLPDLDGLTIASSLKEKGILTPILMISALDDVDERVRGLRAGGDDYLTKPFDLKEMAARVEVLIRRRNADRKSLRLEYADLELDLVAQAARRKGQDLRLFPKERQLLELFMRNPGQVLTRMMIFESVWGYRFDPGTNLIDVHVRALRQKLDAVDPAPLVHTVRGVGYCLRAE